MEKITKRTERFRLTKDREIRRFFAGFRFGGGGVGRGKGQMEKLIFDFDSWRVFLPFKVTICRKLSSKLNYEIRGDKISLVSNFKLPRR